MKALGEGGAKVGFHRLQQRIFSMTHFLSILHCEPAGQCLVLHSLIYYSFIKKTFTEC